MDDCDDPGVRIPTYLKQALRRYREARALYGPSEKDRYNSVNAWLEYVAAERELEVARISYLSSVVHWGDDYNRGLSPEESHRLRSKV